MMLYFAIDILKFC